MDEIEDLYSESGIADASPMMKQYLAIKAKHRDHLLFFRMGDFYEFFFDDAIKISKLINISLTYRNQNFRGKQIPMAGIPFHSIDSYAYKLVNMGYSLAICEQTSDPKLKGLTERSVVKIITPGTLTDDKYLPSNEEKPIIAVISSLFKYSIALMDLSSGRFEISETDNERDFLALLHQINPAEIICMNNDSSVRQLKSITFTKEIDSSEFSLKQAEKRLNKLYGCNFIKEFEFERYSDSIRCSGAIIGYIENTQKIVPTHIKPIVLSEKNSTLKLDRSVIKNLELIDGINGNKKSSLFFNINRTSTSMGARLLYRWILSPSSNKEILEQRLNTCEKIIDSYAFNDIAKIFSQLYDIERIIARISLLSVTPHDLSALRNSLRLIPKINSIINKYNIDYSELNELNCILEILENNLNEDLPNLLRDGNVIKYGVSEDLDKWRNIGLGSENYLKELEKREQKLTGIETLKINYNDVHGYFINIPNGSKSKVPDHYVRKQTLKNSERYIIPELVELEKNRSLAEQEILSLEKDLYFNIIKSISSYIKELQDLSFRISNLDVICSFAIQAYENNYVRPYLNNNMELNIIEGRHPVIEQLSDSQFIPNDSKLSKNRQVLIITGPNMGGKSTYMRQIALIALMAHLGSFVPAKKADIPILDKIFTRIGAGDDISSGLSTFMVEMKEMSNILHMATDKSLLLIDEIGRGTSTYDGLSIAWSCIEYIINNSKSLSLFATHYVELTDLANKYNNISNIYVDSIEHNGKISFLHAVKEGFANKSYGISVAKLAGMPNDVIKNSELLLKSLETHENNKYLSEVNINILPENNNNIELENLKKLILELNINNITPIEALNTLHKIQDFLNIKE